jgi:hypothetical protein
MASSININQNNNDITLQDNNRSISITDNNSGTTVNVTQPVTNVVTVAAIGPQGPVGPIPTSGSFTGSFSGSFIGNLTGTASNATSASYALTASYLEGYISPFPYSGSAVITGSLTVSGSSTFTNIGPAIFSGSVNGNGGFSGSFSGSFQGNGSGLTNLSASAIVGLNLSQIAVGSVSASVSTGTGSFTVTSGSSTFMFVSSSGNVGFGTTTPAFKVDISGIGRINNLTIGDGTYRGTSITFSSQAGGAEKKGIYLDSGGKIYYQSTTNLLGLDSPYNGGTLALSLEGNTNSVQFHNISGTVVSKIISSTGNFLINTTTDAGYKLDVNGTARINTLNIGLGGGQLSTNTVLGFNALNANTSGSNLTAVGASALQNNTTGNENTAVGRVALAGNSTGNYNTAVGYNTLTSANSNSNTAVGQGAGRLVTGAGNTIMGHNAMDSGGVAAGNVSIGYYSLYASTASNNTAVGYQSGYSNTSGEVVAVGYKSLFSNSTGLGNTAVGFQSQLNTNTGGYNTAVGSLTMQSNTNGSQNSAFGQAALQNNTTGNDNTGIGMQSLYSNTSGGQNTSLGFYSLRSNTTGSSNVALGYMALRFNDASQNTAIGYGAGYGGIANVSGSNNIFIGYNSTGVSVGESNRTWIGNSSTTSTWLAGNVLIGTTTDAGYKLDVNGTLRVVNNARFQNEVAFYSTDGNNKFRIPGNSGWTTQINYGSWGTAAIKFIDTPNAGMLLGNTTSTTSLGAMLDLQANDKGLYFNRGTIATMPNLTGNAGMPTFSILSPGSGYTDGYYTAVTATGNYFGSMGVAITVASGVVTAVNLWAYGTKTQVGEVFTVATGSLGVGGSGFSFSLTSQINANPGFTFYNTASNSVTYWNGTNYATPVVSMLDRVNIGSSSVADRSAILQVTSTTQGFLPPRTNTTASISSPAQGLMIYLTGSTNEGLYYYNSGSTPGWRRVADTTFVSASLSGSAGYLPVFTGANSVSSSVIFQSGSNVGIGTATPNAPIHIVYNPALTNGINIDGTTNSLNHIAFLKSGAVYGRLGVNASTGEFRWDSPSSYFPTIYSSGVEAMRISTNRNVLIGTTTDLARLTVKGSGATSATTALLVQNANASSSLAVLDNGYVGINTGSAQYNLDVNGTARVQGSLLTDLLTLSAPGRTIAFNLSSVGGTFSNINAPQPFGIVSSGFGGIVLIGPSSTTSAAVMGVYLNSGNAIQTEVIIGTQTSNASSILNLNSTVRGFLPPRTNLTSNISTPAQGLITYLTGSTNEGLYYYNSGSYQGWTRLLNDSGSQSITGSLTVTNNLILSQSSFTNQNTASLASGTQIISTNATGSYTSAFYNYTLSSGSNARAGQVMSVWNGGSIQFTDIATTDIGSTTAVALTTSLSGANVILSSTLPSSGWTVKTVINLI